ncbi:MAG: hypothetical protein JWM20_574 [Patescibacteria group bacterium]|nr:hypothetical protein [Patescibacteria group bacterium]
MKKLIFFFAMICAGTTMSAQTKQGWVSQEGMQRWLGQSQFYNRTDVTTYNWIRVSWLQGADTISANAAINAGEIQNGIKKGDAVTITLINNVNTPVCHTAIINPDRTMVLGFSIYAIAQ